MGSTRDRTEKFLKAHPVCCFCGGDNAATTQDHFPSRTIFLDRAWPKGYVFPACSECQKISVNDEILVAMIARSTAPVRHADDEKNLKIMFNTVKKLFPDVFSSLVLKDTEKKSWYREMNFERPQGILVRDIPLVSMTHPRFEVAINNFCTKLFCSLYYFHTGNIFPKTGKIYLTWHTNSNAKKAEKFQEILFPGLYGVPELRSQNTDVGTQFNYRYAVAAEQISAAFYCAFHSSFFPIAFLFGDPDKVPDRSRDFGVVLQPFNHNTSVAGGNPQ